MQPLALQKKKKKKSCDLMQVSSETVALTLLSLSTPAVKNDLKLFVLRLL